MHRVNTISFCFISLLVLQACLGILVKVPEIPFMMKLDNGLKVGDKITVTGRILPTASNRFSINIRYGWMESGGIYLFHFDVRFQKSEVISDAHIDGPGWLEHGITPFGFHFTKGNDFVIEILCQEEQFHVMVDGEPFLEYKYKLPLKIADMLSINGDRDRDVEIFSAEVSNSSVNRKGFVQSSSTISTLNESSTFENNCTCDSKSVYLVVCLVFFILLTAVSIVVNLWLTGWLDFCQFTKIVTCLSRYG